MVARPVSTAPQLSLVSSFKAFNMYSTYIFNINYKYHIITCIFYNNIQSTNREDNYLINLYNKVVKCETIIYYTLICQVGNAQQKPKI